MYKPRKTYVAILFSAAVLIPFTANGVYGASMSASSVSKSITAASLFTLDELAGQFKAQCHRETDGYGHFCTAEWEYPHIYTSLQ